jgi:CBS domain containing-hemolysin-like protein
MTDPLIVVLTRLLAVAALIATNGFFVIVEFTLVSAQRTRIERLVAEGNMTARLARHLLNSPDRFIAASQLGITMASLALGWIGEDTIARIVEPPLYQLINAWSVPAAHALGTGISFALITYMHIVLGEQVPKTVAIRYGEPSILFVARPMDAFYRIFRPFIWFLDASTATVLRMLGLRPIAGHRTVYSVEELKQLLRESQEEGELQAEQEEMVRKVFDFGDRRVHEVMIPRTEVVGVEDNASVADLLQIFAQASHARFPVYQGDLDNITGIVAIKDVLMSLAADPAGMNIKVKDLTRPAFFVPETRLVSDLFADMRAAHVQMAIVIDEYGGTAGTVTLEELVEEIVGTLSDELARQAPRIAWTDNHTVRLSAQMRVEEINEELHINLPERDEYKTVAGFILYQLRRIPKEGDQCRYGGLRITVTKMKGPKVEEVTISHGGTGPFPRI